MHVPLADFDRAACDRQLVYREFVSHRPPLQPSQQHESAIDFRFVSNRQANRDEPPRKIFYGWLDPIECEPRCHRRGSELWRKQLMHREELAY